MSRSTRGPGSATRVPGLAAAGAVRRVVAARCAARGRAAAVSALVAAHRPVSRRVAGVAARSVIGLTGRVLMVGLTGGIGSGKSAVARRLAELGAVIIDADRIAREVVAPGTDGLAEIVAAFGPTGARRRRRPRPAPRSARWSSPTRPPGAGWRRSPIPGCGPAPRELVAAAARGRGGGQRRAAAGGGGPGADVPPGGRGADGRRRSGSSG